MARSPKSYLISPNYISRKAIEHLPRSDCFHLSKKECRDRNEDSSLNRTACTGHNRVARPTSEDACANPVRRCQDQPVMMSVAEPQARTSRDETTVRDRARNFSVVGAVYLQSSAAN